MSSAFSGSVCTEGILLIIAKMAATDVEKAERRVETLEQERKESMDALMRHLQVNSSSQVAFELLKPENAKLEKRLDSVNTRLEKALAEVRRQAAVTQQVCWRCACVCVCVCVCVCGGVACHLGHRRKPPMRRN